MILSIKSFRGICYRVKTFLGSLWCVSERGKTSHCTHQPAGLLHTQLLQSTALVRQTKLSLSQTSNLLLVRTQNFLSQTVSRSLHTAVIRQRKKHILKVTEKGSESYIFQCRFITASLCFAECESIKRGNICSL